MLGPGLAPSSQKSHLQHQPCRVWLSLLPSLDSLMDQPSCSSPTHPSQLTSSAPVAGLGSVTGGPRSASHGDSRRPSGPVTDCRRGAVNRRTWFTGDVMWGVQWSCGETQITRTKALQIRQHQITSLISEEQPEDHYISHTLSTVFFLNLAIMSKQGFRGCPATRILLICLGICPASLEVVEWL